MKTMYINEGMAKLLRESVLADAVPSGVIQAIENGKTCFGNNPEFKLGNSFFKTAVVSQFESAKDALKNIGQIETVDAKTVNEALGRIIEKCQKIEQKNKSALEKIAVNYVINLFSIPDDMVKIEANLVESVEDHDDISPVEPFDGDVNFEFDDVMDMGRLDGEIYKRQFTNAINMGAGMRMSENIRGYLEDLYDIDSRLPQMYKEALALNNYMIFESEDLGITDKDRKQIGFVNVKYGNPDELVTVSAEGVIFPVLLCELIRGLMELFSSHGLPKDVERSKYVISKSDFLKAEPWQMRIGPYMWNIFTEYFEDTDTSDMPYIYQVLSKLKPETFFDVVSEMFAKTKKGKRYAEKIIEKATENKERMAFTSKMATHQTKKNVITDEYMHSEEF